MRVDSKKFHLRKRLEQELSPQQRDQLIANDWRQRRPITLPKLKCLEEKPDELPDFLPRRRP